MLSYFSISTEQPDADSTELAIELASKMVGRWPNGNPLFEKKDKQLPEEKMNDFQFIEKDAEGLHCPFGSHIRRSNPRDSFAETTAEGDAKGDAEGDAKGTTSLGARQEARRVVNNHRILRRGRPYGPPIARSMEVRDILNQLDAAEKASRGLNFICFNVNIDRQFEFIQQRWVNNHKFHNRYNDVDPLIGMQTDDGINLKPTQFEVQAKPVRKQYRNIPPFIKVKGGSYFFQPGIRAIQYLASMQGMQG